MTYWISQPENQLFLFGMALLLAGGIVLILLAFPRTPAPVKTWEWHTEPPPAKPPVSHSDFRYTAMDDWYPMAEFALDATAEATTEVIGAITGEVLPRTEEKVTAQLSAVADYYERIETVTVTRDVVVSHRRFDPLDPDVITVEMPQYTTDTPLYFHSRPPAPLRLESFTQGWEPERIARVLEAGRPQ